MDPSGWLCAEGSSGSPGVGRSGSIEKGDEGGTGLQREVGAHGERWAGLVHGVCLRAFDGQSSARRDLLRCVACLPVC